MEKSSGSKKSGVPFALRQRIYYLVLVGAALPLIPYLPNRSEADLSPFVYIGFLLGAFALSFIGSRFLICPSCKYSQNWYGPSGASKAHCVCCGEERDITRKSDKFTDPGKLLAGCSKCGANRTIFSQFSQTNCKWCGEELP